MNEPKMDDPQGSQPGELDEVSPASPAPAIPSGFELTKLSPFEAWMQNLFIGRDGLRPVWRLVLYLLIYRALRFCLYVLIAYGLPGVSRLWLQTAAELGLAIIVLLPALLMARVEGRAFGCYGLPLGNAFGRLFWMGALWGMASLTLLILALRAAHVFLFWGSRAARRAPAEVRRVLGVVLPDRGLLRRILHPRIHPVHLDPGCWASGRRRSCCRWVSARCIWRTRERTG